MEETTEMMSHCIFVVSQLWGNPDGIRQNATLQWYLGATVRSIDKAAEQVRMKVRHVGLYLLARDAYASRSVQEFLQKSHPNFVLSNHSL